MNVKQAIIHEIKKKDGEINKGSYDLSDGIIELDPKVIEMLTELDGRYINLSQTMAVFSEDTGPFPGFFNHYLTNQCESEFVKFSHCSATHLLTYIDKEVNAKGGYLIFVEYEKSVDFVGVFFVRHKKGGSITKDALKRSYVINDSIYIDVERLAMAARINIREYRNTINQRRYISFINKSSVDSKYFTKWICTNELRQDKEDTQLLRTILLELPPPLDDKNEPMDIFDLLNRVHSHVKSIPKGEYVDLAQIGQIFYEDSSALIRYAEENNLDINHTFKPDSAVLRKFVKVKVKADDIAIDFPLSHIEDRKIKIVDNQVIITSEKLVQLIKQEQTRRQNGTDNNPSAISDARG